MKKNVSKYILIILGVLLIIGAGINYGSFTRLFSVLIIYDFSTILLVLGIILLVVGIFKNSNDNISVDKMTKRYYLLKKITGSFIMIFVISGLGCILFIDKSLGDILNFMISFGIGITLSIISAILNIYARIKIVKLEEKK